MGFSCKMSNTNQIFNNLTSFWFIAILSIISLNCGRVSGLECYACERQDGNIDKCIKTTKQCEENQDICRSTITWGLPRYWTPYGERVHYVSKECATRTVCEADKATIINRCRRDWFDDWMCVDCCSGDLCNYYVTLTASQTRGEILLTMTLAALVSYALVSFLSS